MLVGMPFFLWHRMIRYKKKNKRLYILRKTAFVLEYDKDFLNMRGTSGI